MDEPTGTQRVNDAGRVTITADRPTAPVAPMSQPPAQPAAKDIESIRRTLYNALNKLDQLQGNLKTT